MFLQFLQFLSDFFVFNSLNFLQRFSLAAVIFYRNDQTTDKLVPFLMRNL